MGKLLQTPTFFAGSGWVVKTVFGAPSSGSMPQQLPLCLRLCACICVYTWSLTRNHPEKLLEDMNLHQNYVHQRAPYSTSYIRTMFPCRCVRIFRFNSPPRLMDSATSIRHLANMLHEAHGIGLHILKSRTGTHTWAP